MVDSTVRDRLAAPRHPSWPLFVLPSAKTTNRARHGTQRRGSSTSSTSVRTAAGANTPKRPRRTENHASRAQAKRTCAAPRCRGVGACRSRIARGTCSSTPARRPSSAADPGTAAPRRRTPSQGCLNESAPVPAGYEAGLGARSREERYCALHDDRTTSEVQDEYSRGSIS